MRRTRVRPVSDRRRAERPARHDVVEAAGRRDGWRCRARELVGGPCAGPLDPHEIIPRSAWAADYLELDNIVTVCRRHHDWIGDNPTAAHDAGLHRFSWERP